MKEFFTVISFALELLRRLFIPKMRKKIVVCRSTSGSNFSISGGFAVAYLGVAYRYGE
jgi:hypothetical protein